MIPRVSCAFSPGNTIDLLIIALSEGEDVPKTASAPTGGGFGVEEIPRGLPCEQARLHVNFLALLAGDVFYLFNTLVEIKEPSSGDDHGQCAGGDESGDGGVGGAGIVAQPPNQKDTRHRHSVADEQRHRRAGVAEKYDGGQDHGHERVNRRGAAALHAAQGPEIIPRHQGDGDDQNEVKISSGVIFVIKGGGEIAGHPVFDQPEDPLGGGDFLQDAKQGEDGAVGHHRRENGLDGYPAGKSGGQGAGEGPRSAADREHPPSVHAFERRGHPAGQPFDVLDGGQPPVGAGGRPNVGGVERLAGDVTEKEQSEPEGRELQQA